MEAVFIAVSVIFIGLGVWSDAVEPLLDNTTTEPTVEVTE
tara:strand:+ start:118 stop:237 length:120 start_codon:yes stop_codon:yes gene_type:complete